MAGRITLGVAALLLTVWGVDGAIDSECNICSEESKDDLRVWFILTGICGIVALVAAVGDRFRVAVPFLAGAIFAMVGTFFVVISNLR